MAWTKKQKREWERSVRNQTNPRYQVISTPKRESPNYIVQGPGREGLISVPPAAFNTWSNLSSGSVGENLPAEAVRAVARENPQLTTRSGYRAARKKAKKSSSSSPDPAYTLLSGFTRKRVRRLTLLRGSM